jgi:type I restriction enzyme S subunit
MASNGWKTIRLGDVCLKIGSGATPRGGSEAYLEHGPFTLIRSQNVYNDGFHRDGLAFIDGRQAAELSNVEVKKDDVLLNITGDSVARCCQVETLILPARVSQHVTIVRPDPEKLNPRFLRYFLVSPKTQVRLLSWAGSGGTRKALTKGMIESFEVLAPEDLDEQRAIAHILGTLDDKIELNRRMNETLEAIARAIFKSWFADFDPVRAKAEGRDPGLPKHIADLFPDSFEDSELGEIPKGWRINTVGEEFNLTMGQSPPGETYNEIGEGIPFFQGRADFGFRYPKHRVFCTAPTRFADRGDTLVSVRAPVGDINMALERCSVGRGVAAIRHKSGSRSYTYYAMRSLVDVFGDFEAEGTVFGCINKDDFHRIKFIAAPQQLVWDFEKAAFPIDETIENHFMQCRTLAALRDALLPMLISGEIRVKDAERFLVNTL